MSLRLPISVALLAAACAAPRVSAPASCPRPELHGAVDELYRAFSFDAGAQPDWAAQEELFHPDARFFPPAAPGRTLRARDTDAFLAEFRQYASEGEVAAKGLHERVIGVTCAGFGDVAQTAVAFEGFHPAEGAAVSRGVDTILWIRTADGWRLASFATQYEREGLELDFAPTCSTTSAPRHP